MIELKKIVIDVDTGTDDAVAIMVAALHPALELRGVTAVRGNIEVDDVVENSLRVLEFIGRPDIPVYRGASRPWRRDDFPVPRHLRRQKGIHTRELPLPPATIRAADGEAVSFLLDAFGTAGATTLVAVGPLTNIALALEHDPGFADRVPELVIMGGGHARSNESAAAEFNIWADADAAAAVFKAGFRKLTVVSLDATMQAMISRDQVADLATLGTPAATATARFMNHRIDAYDARIWETPRGVAPLHDAVCVASLVAPDILVGAPRHVAVETKGELTIGRTVVDMREQGAEPPNCWFATAARGDVLFDVLKTTFATAPSA